MANTAEKESPPYYPVNDKVWIQADLETLLSFLPFALEHEMPRRKNFWVRTSSSYFEITGDRGKLDEDKRLVVLPDLSDALVTHFQTEEPNRQIGSFALYRNVHSLTPELTIESKTEAIQGKVKWLYAQTNNVELMLKYLEAALVPVLGEGKYIPHLFNSLKMFGSVEDFSGVSVDVVGGNIANSAVAERTGHKYNKEGTIAAVAKEMRAALDYIEKQYEGGLKGIAKREDKRIILMYELQLVWNHKTPVLAISLKLELQDRHPIYFEAEQVLAIK